MAEVTAFRNNALPYPVYGAPYTVVFPILDADGDPVTGATCDSEVSKNGDTGADCTNEGTEITYTTATNKGMYYLSLTAAEMTADIVAVTIYPDSGKTTPIVLYPRKLVTLASGTAQGGAAGYITLAASTVAFDGQFNGCLCVATLDGTVEARVLQTCTTADQQCTVTPNWVMVQDNDDTYIVYLPEGMQIPQTNVKAISDDATAANNCELMYDGTGYAGGSTKLQTDMTQILAHTLTDTGTQLADGFEKFFNVGTPTGTVNSLPDAVAGAAGGVFVAGTNAATTVTTSFTTTFTGNLTGSVASVSGAVGSVTGLTIANGAVDAKVTYILDSALSETSVGYLAAGFKKFFDIATPVFTMATINQTGDSYARIGAAGVTLTNLGGMSTTMKGQINTEADAAIVSYNLDHLALTACDTNDVTMVVADQTILAVMMAADGDISAYNDNTDSLEALQTSTVGVGASTYTLTVTDGTNPIDNVSAWITTDEAGSNVTAGPSYTDSNGEVVFQLDPGTPWAWKQHGGYTFTNPEQITVT